MLACTNAAPMSQNATLRGRCFPFAHVSWADDHPQGFQNLRSSARVAPRVSCHLGSQEPLFTRPVLTTDERATNCLGAAPQERSRDHEQCILPAQRGELSLAALSHQRWVKELVGRLAVHVTFWQQLVHTRSFAGPPQLLVTSRGTSSPLAVSARFSEESGCGQPEVGSKTSSLASSTHTSRPMIVLARFVGVVHSSSVSISSPWASGSGLATTGVATELGPAPAWPPEPLRSPCCTAGFVVHHLPLASCGLAAVGLLRY